MAQLFSLGHIRAMKILSAILGLLGGWAIVGNWWIVIRWYVFRKKGESLVPIFGGVLFTLAMITYPEPRVRHLAWIPLIVDLGCSLMIPGFLYAVFVDKVFKK